jgi:hypothetical protein
VPQLPESQSNKDQESLGEEFHGVVSKTVMSYEKKLNLDKTPTLSGEFHSMVLLTFNFTTHRELVIVLREHFFSLFLNTLSCHKNNYVTTY